MLTTWLAGYRNFSKHPRAARARIARLEAPPPSLTNLPAWPDRAAIRDAQVRSSATASPDAAEYPGGARHVRDLLWILPDDSKLHARLFTVTHCGDTNHRGDNSTLHAIR